MLVLSRCLNETVTIHCPDGSKIKIVVINLLDGREENDDGR